MTDSSAKLHTSSPGTGLLMYAAGALFLCGGATLLYVVGRLLFPGQSPIEISGHDQLFWLLCGVVGLCVIMLGVNFLGAAWRRQSHNIVPGPTLYLLGVTLVILGMFMAVSGAWISAGVLALAGIACMRLEYRSEFI